MNVAPTIRIEHLSLVAQGSSITLSLDPGQALAVAGRGGAGKSRFLRVLAGKEKPTSGAIFADPHRTLCDASVLPRKGKVNGLARTSSKVQDIARTTETLVAAGLWNQRNIGVEHLTPSQSSAACVMPALSQPTEIILIDMLLDWVDPIVQTTIWNELSRLRQSGVIVIVATHSTQIIEQCDALLVLRDQNFAYSGSIEHLRERSQPYEFTVETDRHLAIKNMIEPFCVQVEETSGGLLLKTFEHQKVAQKLLLDGYGDVKYIVKRQPSFADLVRELY
jgi:ABC-2 type transport system ATP-binding protein